MSASSAQSDTALGDDTVAAALAVADASIVADAPEASDGGPEEAPANEPVASPATGGAAEPADVDAPAASGSDGGGEGEDAYVPGTSAAPARIPKFKKKRDAADDGDDGDDGGDGSSGGDDDDDEGGSDDDARRRRKKRRSDKRQRRARAEREVEDEDADEQPEMDEATRRRLALEERIENIGKKPKVQRRKKKGGEDVDVVDSYHDEICARLRDRMIAAADRDETANRSKLPATSKLAMLDEVVGVLQNTTLWTSIVDNGVLEAVRRWLEPLPDRSLPAVGIQRAIFEILPRMDFDTTTLKECRLGPIVLFYTKTKRVAPAISRQADALVQAWSRPIVKRPADFRSRHVARAGDADEADDDVADDDDAADARGAGASQGAGQSQRDVKPVIRRRFDVRQALRENESRKGARPLRANDVQYTVAPESRMQHRADDLHHVSRIQMDNRKFNRFARQLKSGKR